MKLPDYVIISKKAKNPFIFMRNRKKFTQRVVRYSFYKRNINGFFSTQRLMKKSLPGYTKITPRDIIYDIQRGILMGI